MDLRDDRTAVSRDRMMVAGCDLTELAQEYGTPFIVLDESAIRQRCRAFVRGLKDSGLGGTAYYAAEALAAKAVMHIARQEGMGVAASSIEVALAARDAGFDPGQITLHGPAKPDSEIDEAVSMGAGRIVIDSFDEIEAIQRIAGGAGVRQAVMLRVNPGLSGPTRSRETLWGVMPGGRFGLSIEDGEALRAVKTIAQCPNLQLVGLHTHIGSQIESPQPYNQALEKLTDLAVLAMFVTGCEAGEMNIGGGFPIRWSEGDEPPAISSWLFAIAQNLRMMSQRKGMNPPAVSVEPGRAVVSEAGTLVSSVRAVKRAEGFRSYAVLDARAPRAVDPAFASRSGTFTLANRKGDPDNDIYVLADRTGDPDGIFTWDAYLPEVRAGDLIAQLSTGSWPWAERGPGQPVVLIAQYGRALPIVARPDASYFTQLDKVPNRLNR